MKKGTEPRTESAVKRSKIAENRTFNQKKKNRTWASSWGPTRVRAAPDPGRCVGSTARACSAGGQHGVVSSTRRVRVVTGTPTAGQAAFSLSLSFPSPPGFDVAWSLLRALAAPVQFGGRGTGDWWSSTPSLPGFRPHKDSSSKSAKRPWCPLLSRPEQDTACLMLLCDGFPSLQLTV